jgi:hypothetical protein
MSADKNRNEFETMLSDFDPAVQELAREARRLIFDVLPQTVEVVWTRQKIAGYGTGPKKMTEHFSYISPHKKHINFGFYYGRELPDPAGLLEGTGELMRHVKIKSVAELENPALRTMLEFAVTHRVPPPKSS